MKRASAARASLVLLALLSGCDRHEAPLQPASAVSNESFVQFWPLHRSATYTVSLASQVNTGLSGSFSTQLDATLTVTPLRVVDTHAELRFALASCKLSTERRQVADDLNGMSAELQKPFVVSFDSGVVTDTRFAPGLSAQSVAMLRTLASALTLADNHSARAWSASELDATGQYDAAYELAADGKTISKHKTRYTKTLLSAKVDPALHLSLSPEILSSSGAFTLQTQAIESVSLDDHTKTALLQGALIEASNRVSMKLTGVSPAAPGAEDHDALFGATHPFAPDRAYGSAPTKRMFEGVADKAANFPDLLARLEAEARNPEANNLWGTKNGQAISSEEEATRKEESREQIALFSSLVGLVRSDPSVLPKIEQQVKKQSPAARELLDGLVSASTPAAMSLLAKLVSDPHLPTTLRADGATSFIRIHDPSKEDVAVLRGWLNDPLLGDHAVYGLGTASRHLRDNGDSVLANEIAEQLIGLTRAAKTTPERVRCLRGIANSGYSGALPVVEPLITSDDPTVRTSALEALRLMDTPKVEPLLIERMANDSDHRVRAAAVSAARRRSATDALAAAVSARALADDAPLVRSRAVELLGQWLTERPSLRATLEQVAARELVPQVRDSAKSALKKS
ncbi:MAG TPA: HEAT repeat domain-containing protein [Polyangiaceae bacterium]